MNQPKGKSMIQALLLTNNTVIISEIEEMMVDLGEPNCKLVKPFVIKDNELERFLRDYTEDTEFMISSDNIITLFKPLEDIEEQYIELSGIKTQELSPKE